MDGRVDLDWISSISNWWETPRLYEKGSGGVKGIFPTYPTQELMQYTLIIERLSDPWQGFTTTVFNLRLDLCLIITLLVRIAPAMTLSCNRRIRIICE